MGYLAGYEKVWRVGESRGYAVLVPYPAKPSRPAADVSAPDPSAAGVVRKVVLPMIGPMVRRRVLVPSARFLHELRGLTRARLSWKGIHPHRFCLHSRILTRSGGAGQQNRPDRLGDDGARRGLPGRADARCRRAMKGDGDRSIRRPTHPAGSHGQHRPPWRLGTGRETHLGQRRCAAPTGQKRQAQKSR